ncbi:hypothetical protein C437_11068 [Haloarcula vallismortis ATCC 29715]|uniref:DICT domain-containing protein n=1 Tax=Haloarcula vallismortis ATCC 29715 TaxID=662477 RepID=M0JBZ7_HALVA|nr:DICT sensory domain-containing protein [Haloarcula vallismortis]EMA06642.1 hypothetical protein C437_11068 [Haloarcula vallismortis ATCC 29715]
MDNRMCDGVTISAFIDTVSLARRTLTVFNDDEPEPLVRMLKRMVDSPAVDVRAGEVSAETPRNAVVVEDADGTELAVSSISEISACVLLVNSDLYVTGTRSLDEVDTPGALLHLDEVPFTVTGKRKMLLIELSRYIESLGWQSDNNTLHAGFQYLSRIDDERGTRRVYDRLADSDTDLHLYGLPDRVSELPGNSTIHTEPRDELRESWFVVNTDCTAEMKGVLLAERTGRSQWRGYWSFDADHVDEISAYLQNRYST